MTDLPDAAILAVAALGGAVCAVGATMYLSLYVGVVPVPLSAVLFGGLLALLSLASRRIGGQAWQGGVPVVGFLLVVLIFLLGGRGGSIMYNDWRVLVLVACGIGLPIAAQYLASSNK